MANFRQRSDTKSGTKTRRKFGGFPREMTKKYCRLCRDKVNRIDYKELGRLQRFMTEKGKILSRRISGNCAKHQRKIMESIKRARFLALLPYAKR